MIGPAVTYPAHQPSLDAYWRAIILFGRHPAAYKFALGSTLQQCVQRQPYHSPAAGETTTAETRSGPSSGKRLLSP